MTATKSIIKPIKRVAVISALSVALFAFAVAPSVGATGTNQLGNPGNHKDVGRAGESPNGLDFGAGDKGRSDVGF
jgi:hypothetical protein